MTKSTKIVTTSKRARNVKPMRAMGDQAPASGPSISTSADKDKVQPTTLKSVAARAQRTRNSGI